MPFKESFILKYCDGLKQMFISVQIILSFFTNFFSNWIIFSYEANYNSFLLFIVMLASYFYAILQYLIKIIIVITTFMLFM